MVRPAGLSFWYSRHRLEGKEKVKKGHSKLIFVLKNISSLIHWYTYNIYNEEWWLYSHVSYYGTEMCSWLLSFLLGSQVEYCLELTEDQPTIWNEYKMFCHYHIAAFATNCHCLTNNHELLNLIPFSTSYDTKLWCGKVFIRTWLSLMSVWDKYYFKGDLSGTRENLYLYYSTINHIMIFKHRL